MRVRKKKSLLGGYKEGFWLSYVGNTDYQIANAFAVGSGGRIMSVGNLILPSVSSGFITMHARDGTLLWQKAYAGSGTVQFWAVALAPDGDFIIGAHINGYCAVLKVTANGVVVWARTLGEHTRSSAQGVARTNAIAVDAAGNIYCACTYFAGSVYSDLALFKLDSSGALLMSRVITQAPFYVDIGTATSIALDSEGGIYLQWIVYAYCYVAKFDAAWTQVWQKRLGGVNGNYGRSLCVYGDSVYFMCETNQYGAGGYDSYIARMLLSDGSTVWHRVIGSTQYDRHGAMHVDAQGVFVYAQTAVNNYDLVVMQITHDGTTLSWARQFQSAATEYTGYNMVAFSRKSLIFGGVWRPGSGQNNAMTIHYPKDGSVVGTFGSFTIVSWSPTFAIPASSFSNGPLTVTTTTNTIAAVTLTVTDTAFPQTRIALQ